VTGILLLMLEDDSMHVRLAGIRAMGRFAARVQSVRKRCLNFLIDMLNDEIDEVRIGALHAIEQFNEILSISDYEVDIVLFNLNEDNAKLRDEIYKFFGSVRISQEALLLKLFQKLWLNLEKFGHQDKHMIFTLMSQLGSSHKQLVAKTFDSILAIDKRFLCGEPNWKDPVYVSKMILIFNAY